MKLKANKLSRSNINAYDITGPVYGPAITHGQSSTRYVQDELFKQCGFTARKNKTIKIYMSMVSESDWSCGEMNSKNLERVRKQYNRFKVKCSPSKSIKKMIDKYGSLKLKHRFNTRRVRKRVALLCDVRDITSVKSMAIEPLVLRMVLASSRHMIRVVHTGEKLQDSDGHIVFMRMVSNARIVNKEHFCEETSERFGNTKIFGLMQWYPISVRGSVRTVKLMFERAYDIIIPYNNGVIIMDDETRHRIRCHMKFLDTKMPISTTGEILNGEWPDYGLHEVDCSKGGVLAQVEIDGNMIYGIKNANIMDRLLIKGELNSVEESELPQT